jgi:hypothetical protein
MRIAGKQFASLREGSCSPVPCIVSGVCSSPSMGIIMKSAFAFAILLLLALTSNPTHVWGADAVSDADQVKRQAALVPSLQKAAAGAGGYATSSIKVQTSAHQVTIDVINSKLNGATAADRNADASAIASAIARAIADKTEFAAVVTIHIDYVGGVGSSAKVLQGLVFNKGADGAFKPHQS